MEEWVEHYILGALSEMDKHVRTGLAPLTYTQACTLIRIIVWACKHDDCPVTIEEGKDLCKAIQYISSTRPKEEEG